MTREHVPAHTTPDHVVPKSDKKLTEAQRKKEKQKKKMRRKLLHCKKKLKKNKKS